MTSQTAFLINFIRSWALILCLLTFGLRSAHAEPGMTDITVDANENFLILNAILTDAFTEKLLEVVESGVPLTFTYQIELLEHVSVFADDVVSSNEVTNTVHYDTLKEVFIFTSEGKHVHRKVHTKSLERYQILMLTLKGIPVAPLYKLDRDEQYYVRVKAEMDTDDGLWFPFNYLLFFVPFKEFETAWADSSPLVLDVDPDFPLDDSNKESTSGNILPKVLDDATRSFSQ